MAIVALVGGPADGLLTTVESTDAGTRIVFSVESWPQGHYVLMPRTPGAPHEHTATWSADVALDMGGSSCG